MGHESAKRGMRGQRPRENITLIPHFETGKERGLALPARPLGDKRKAPLVGLAAGTMAAIQHRRVDHLPQPLGFAPVIAVPALDVVLVHI